MTRKSVASPAEGPRQRPSGRTWHRPGIVLPVLAAVVFLPVSGIAVAAQSSDEAAAPETETKTLTVTATEDAYVAEATPTYNFGGNQQISAVSIPGAAKVSYVKFRVAGLPSGATVTGTTVDLRRTLHHLSGSVEAHRVASAWSQKSVTWQKRPGVGPVLSRVAVNASSRGASLALPGLVAGNGDYSIAITTPNTADHVRFRSIEAGAEAPRLTVTYAIPVAGPKPQPTVTASRPTATVPAAATPTTARPTTTTVEPTSVKPTTAEPSDTTKPPVTTTTKPSTVLPGTGRTLYGASPDGVPGETPEAAFSRIDQAFGGMDAVRWWPADGSVPKWSALPARFGNRAIAMSMKLPPAAVAAGSYDAQLAEFFRTAPTDRLVLATFYHEPEDNIANGEFTVDQYKAAWARFNQIARANKPANVRTTMILMGGTWTNTNGYGHDWHYYIQPGTFDVLGGDDYQTLKKSTADQTVGPHIAAAKELGVPLAILELGALHQKTDAERADFLGDVVRLVDGKALMVLQYESWRGKKGPWNVLNVAPSAATVWKAACTDAAKLVAAQ